VRLEEATHGISTDGIRREEGGDGGVEGGASGLVRRIISDGSKRNGLLVRKAPNIAGANILARDVVAGEAWMVS